MSWASAIYGLIKAVPALIGIFQQVMDLYWTELNQRVEEQSSKVAKERDALVASLKNDALTPEQRVAIRRRLYELQSQ